MNYSFQILKEIAPKKARTALLELNGYIVKTPAFMPVGTKGSVKTLTPRDMKELGYSLVLANTYHLFLRPGHELIGRLGGLKSYMNWDGLLLTDSGGFQVFSLANLNKVSDQGVLFSSHLDGTKYLMTPELSMEIQRALGSDIVMAFDVCPPLPSSEKDLEEAVNRTQAWAIRGLETPLQPHQIRFGIVQGGLSRSLREKSLMGLTKLPFHGFAIGGLSVGEAPKEMHSMVEWLAPQLPSDKPRYLMGVGRPEDLVEAVSSGVDLFDCVLPTRNGRNGQIFTWNGKINIKNSCYQEDLRPLDPLCGCETCVHYSRAYLRHLFCVEEPTAGRLLTLHNLSFYRDLMEKMRDAISQNEFDGWKKNFYTQYYGKPQNSVVRSSLGSNLVL